MRNGTNCKAICGHRRLCNGPLCDTIMSLARVKLKSVRSVAEISSLKDQPKMHYLLKISEAACDERNHQNQISVCISTLSMGCMALAQAQVLPHTIIQNPCGARLFIFHMECGRHWTRIAFSLRQYTISNAISDPNLTRDQNCTHKTKCRAPCSIF